MKTQTYSILQNKFWQAYWITMRPYLLFVSGVAGMVGFVDGPELPWLSIAGIFFAFFLSYGFGQALTDCFQIDTDSISSPYRPLVQGIITRKQVLTVSFLGLLGCCFILYRMNYLTLWLGLLSVYGLATYTYYKRRWWSGPFYNAWIVAVLPIIGKWAALGPETGFNQIFRNGLIIPIIISVFFSYANFVLMGYFKDISADRASGYNTFVVKFGWNNAAIGSDLFAAVSIAATGWAMVKGLFNIPVFAPEFGAALIFGAAVIVLIAAQTGIHKINDEKLAHKPITNVVRGFLMLHLSVIQLLRPAWWVGIILFYVLFEITLKFRPEKGQV